MALFCHFSVLETIVVLSWQEPAWVKANHSRQATQAQKLLRAISGGGKDYSVPKKLELVMLRLLF